MDLTTHRAFICKAIQRVAISLLAGLVTISATATVTAPDYSHASVKSASGQRSELDIVTIPIFLSASTSTVCSGSTVTISVTVDRIPTGGGTVMVGCTDSAALTPPGGTWPYALSFPSSGSTTQSVALVAQSLSSAEDVQVYTYLTNATNPSDPSCWQQVVTIHVVPGCG